MGGTDVESSGGRERAGGGEGAVAVGFAWRCRGGKNDFAALHANSARVLDWDCWGNTCAEGESSPVDMLLASSLNARSSPARETSNCSSSFCTCSPRSCRSPFVRKEVAPASTPSSDRLCAPLPTAPASPSSAFSGRPSPGPCHVGAVPRTSLSCASYSGSSSGGDVMGGSVHHRAIARPAHTAALGCFHSLAYIWAKISIFAKLSYWCIGYHICLTHRRRLVRPQGNS